MNKNPGGLTTSRRPLVLTKDHDDKQIVKSKFLHN